MRFIVLLAFLIVCVLAVSAQQSRRSNQRRPATNVVLAKAGNRRAGALAKAQPNGARRAIGAAKPRSAVKPRGASRRKVAKSTRRLGARRGASRSAVGARRAGGRRRLAKQEEAGLENAGGSPPADTGSAPAPAPAAVPAAVPAVAPAPAAVPAAIPAAAPAPAAVPAAIPAAVPAPAAAKPAALPNNLNLPANFGKPGGNGAFGAGFASASNGGTAFGAGFASSANNQNSAGGFGAAIPSQAASQPVAAPSDASNTVENPAAEELAQYRRGSRRNFRG